MTSDNTITITGIGVSPGIAIGPAHLVGGSEPRRGGSKLGSDSEVPGAIAAFDEAVAASVREVETIGQKAGRSLTEEEQAIAETQVEFLTDPQLRENVIEKISTDKLTPADAVIDAIAEQVKLFSEMEDEYLRARAADIEDIGRRIGRHLGTNVDDHLQNARKGAILIAAEISPSDAIVLDLSAIAGFVTRTGGRTSHTALLARSKRIPAVVGAGSELDLVRQGDLLIVDGAAGTIIVHPDPAQLVLYEARQRGESARAAVRPSRRPGELKTSDGTEVKLMLNISGPGDLDSAESAEADGVGLYRTEMLFMRATQFPQETEQIEQYRQVMEKAGQRPVIFRTIDIGGDKPLPYFPFPKEENPFLGYRAIRFSLDRREIFLTQLRAILRATAGGNAGIMFPMIGQMQECREALAVLAQAETELEKEGLAFNRNIRKGIMIEIPGAALIADLLAKEVDFFSIGTNDLCQYTLAVDRMNEKITDLYDPFHPGLLRLIRGVIEAGHRSGIAVGLCGEMAGDPLATRLLLGMGLREFSMSAPSIPETAEIVAGCTIAEARQLAESVLETGDAGGILSKLKTYS